MKKKWFSILLALVLFFSLVVGACSSAPRPAPSPTPVNIAGTWRFSDRSGVLILEIGANGAGTMDIFNHDGNRTVSGVPVVADGSGGIKIDQRNARYRLIDVVAGGNYLGEQLTITGWMDAPVSLHNTNPPKTISLGGTSWSILYTLPVTFVFNDDGSFRIDLGPEMQSANEVFWNADTEGTYTVNGIEVTLNYPNGKAFKWTRGNDGSIVAGVENTDSQRIFIEGDSFLLGYAVFGLSE